MFTPQLFTPQLFLGCGWTQAGRGARRGAGVLVWAGGLVDHHAFGTLGEGSARRRFALGNRFHGEAVGHTNQLLMQTHAEHMLAYIIVVELGAIAFEANTDLFKGHPLRMRRGNALQHPEREHHVVQDVGVPGAVLEAGFETTGRSVSICICTTLVLRDPAVV